MITDMQVSIEAMRRASIEIRDSTRVEAELRGRIETQRAQIEVALGYIRAGQDDLAAMALGGKLPTKQEVAP